MYFFCVVSDFTRGDIAYVYSSVQCVRDVSKYLAAKDMEDSKCVTSENLQRALQYLFNLIICFCSIRLHR